MGGGKAFAVQQRSVRSTQFPIELQDRLTIDYRATVIDQWLMRNLMDTDSIRALPARNYFEPLSYSDLVPAGARSAYLAIHEEMRRLWRPVSEIEREVESVKASFGVQAHSDTPRGHVIGVHWRGGDKYRHECLNNWSVVSLTALGTSLRLAQSGNATLYMLAVQEALDQLPTPSCTTCKPTIALMTVEPEALQLFLDEPLSAQYNIRSLPPPVG